MASHPSPLEVLIIDDHPLFRAGIATVLQRLADDARLIERPSCEDGLRWLAEHADPVMILLDLNLPGMDGMSGLGLLREASPTTPIVVLSATEDRTKVKQALSRGAMGYIPKSANGDVILNAIRLVLAGGVYLPAGIMAPASPDSRPNEASAMGNPLTPRQQEVLELLCQGLSNKAIAARLDLAENTVRVHVAAILKLLGARNRTEAGYQALSLGLVKS